MKGGGGAPGAEVESLKFSQKRGSDFSDLKLGDYFKKEHPITYFHTNKSFPILCFSECVVVFVLHNISLSILRFSWRELLSKQMCDFYQSVTLDKQIRHCRTL